MSAKDPNVAMVELVAAALGTLREEVVIVGGCAAGLLLTDPAASPVRVTYDVDLVVEVAALAGYHRMEAQLVQRGFTRDLAQDAPICRWRYNNLEVDLMPIDPGILGFANRWYPLAMESAQWMALPNGINIRAITGPAFIATKFEAFDDRGRGDILASHDLEDIISVIDGRPELMGEAAVAAPELRHYLASRCRQLLATPGFMDYLPGMIVADESLAARVTLIIARLRRLGELNNV